MTEISYGDELQFTLADRLRKSREHVGLTQAGLAAQMGVTVSTISRAERGLGITHRTLRQWAWVCAVDMDWLNAGSTCACTTCAPGQVA